MKTKLTREFILKHKWTKLQNIKDHGYDGYGFMQNNIFGFDIHISFHKDEEIYCLLNRSQIPMYYEHQLKALYFVLTGDKLSNLNSDL